MIQLIAIIAAIFLGLAFVMPFTLESVLLTWLASILLVYLRRNSNKLVRDLFVFGFVLTPIGFYWVIDTIVFFGEFPRWLAVILFSIFCFYSALQFVLVAWLYKYLKSNFVRLEFFLFPLSWVLVEFFMPRVFPWNLANTQIIWTGFASLAEFVGVFVLSGLMLFVSEIVVEICTKGFRRKLVYFGLPSVLLLFGVGYYGSFKALKKVWDADYLTVGLVQGNLEAKKKGDLKYFKTNIKTYRELSREVADEGAEIVFWPEAVLNFWLPEAKLNLSGTGYHPDPKTSLPMLFGGLSFREGKNENKFFNTAFGMDANGQISGFYHKKILMPFGEYLPFANWFPWIKKLSPRTGDFTKGDLGHPIEFLVGEERSVKVMPLVCYEDLVSKLGTQSLDEGAEILVNLTNDAWYGDTVAPYQHHLLAAWRSVETRRTLLRVTNTGLTAVVNPLGQTIAELPIFTEGLIVKRVSLLKDKTLYSVIGNWPIKLFSLMLIFSIIYQKIVIFFGKNKSKKS